MYQTSFESELDAGLSSIEVLLPFVLKSVTTKTQCVGVYEEAMWSCLSLTPLFGSQTQPAERRRSQRKRQWRRAATQVSRSKYIQQLKQVYTPTDLKKYHFRTFRDHLASHFGLTLKQTGTDLRWTRKVQPILSPTSQQPTRRKCFKASTSWLLLIRSERSWQLTSSMAP